MASNKKKAGGNAAASTQKPAQKGALSSGSELRSRILFTLIALIVYRIGSYIPVPGVDFDVMKSIFEANSDGIGGLINTFTGGALGRMTVFALNIMPYITASIIINLMTVVSKRLESLKKEGDSGRRVLNQYTRYLTIIIATVHGFGIANFLTGQNAAITPGTFFTVSTIVTLVGGTVFLMWLGEQITSRGIGNGISLIIFAGIVAELPGGLAQVFEQGQSGALSTGVLLTMLALAIGLIFFVVFIERSQRRLLIQYPKRQVGQKVYGGENSHLPLKINMAGVIPAIFASAILLFPVTIAGMSSSEDGSFLSELVVYMGPGTPLFIAVYAALIMFFCFFYTSIQFNPTETADNLKKNNGFIPGIRPGEHTAKHLDYVITRLTVIGALYVAFVCVVPEIFMSEFEARLVILSGTSILIIVSVVIDTFSQVQGYLLTHQYEGLMKKANFKRKSIVRR